MKPVLCNENAPIYVPDVECSDCAEVKRELEEFEAEMDACCEEVKDRLANVEDGLDTKQDTLTAGANITIVDGVISATGGTGEVTEQAILSALGYAKINIAMADDTGETHTWEVIGKEI